MESSVTVFVSKTVAEKRSARLRFQSQSRAMCLLAEAAVCVFIVAGCAAYAQQSSSLSTVRVGSSTWGVADARGDGVADDTQAIQAAIDRAAAAGGGTVYLQSGRFRVTGLVVPSGVHLLGSGYTFHGSGPGTVLVHASHSGAVLTLTGDDSSNGGLGVELGNFQIMGSDQDHGLERGIALLAGRKEIPRSYNLHDLSINGFSGTSLYMNATSYGWLRNISMGAGCGTGMDVESSGRYTEETHFVDINTQGCTQYGVKIVGGNNLYFDHLSLNDSPVGLYITGSAFDLFFTSTNIVRSGSAGIDLEAEGDFLGRIHFLNTSILMAGVSTAETAVRAHRHGRFTVFNVDFDWTDVNLAGSIAPKAAIVEEEGTCASFQSLRNVTNGAVRIPSGCVYSVDGTAAVTGTVAVGGGNLVVYRCTAAGVLPVGALTVQRNDCRASEDTGLRTR